MKNMSKNKNDHSTKKEQHTIIIPIKGMHCRSCEISVEQELLKIQNVKKATVSVNSKNAEIVYEGDFPTDKVDKAVIKCGYSVEEDIKNTPWISSKSSDYEGILGGILFFLLTIILTKNFGFFNLDTNISKDFSNLYIVLLVGITAGLSTCMALIGGLVLGVAAKFSEQHPNTSTYKKFRPHIIFNLGRIISFFILGGAIGYFGSLFQLNTQIIGVITLIVSIVMLILGIQTLGISPAIDKIKFTLPKSLYSLLGIEKHKQNEYSNKGTFLLGALTFFLPCGFTQTMQLFALASGDAKTGALTMGIFAIGTSLGLLSIGGITAVVKGSFAKTFFKFVGLVVIAMAILNFSNGFNLIGITLPSVKSAQNVKIDSNVTTKNGVQIVEMTQKTNGYFPNKFTIKKGIPVKWVVTSETSNSCAASLISSQLGIRKILDLGENTFEFTPDKVGTIKFSCSMGMYKGTFEVVD